MDFATKIHDGAEVPYVVDHSGVQRLLTALPTPRDHPVGAKLIPFDRSGMPELTITQIEAMVREVAARAAEREAIRQGHSVVKAVAQAGTEVNRVRPDVPILDQGSDGACVAHSFVAACMIAKSIAGDPFLDLDPFFLYTLINGGVDQGANAGEAAYALMTVGCCPRGIVPYGTYRPPGYSPQALAAAKHCKLRSAVEIKGYEQALTAILYGWTVAFDVRAGNTFYPDANGVCAFLPGPTNHEVVAAEQIKAFQGVYCPGGRNSWGTSWGLGGRTYWQPRHLDSADTTYAIKLVAADPDAPPLLPGG